MPLLIPKCPSPGQTGKTVRKVTTKSDFEWKSKSARIANQWTSDERAERRRQSIAKRKWLVEIIVNSSRDQE